MDKIATVPFFLHRMNVIVLSRNRFMQIPAEKTSVKKTESPDTPLCPAIGSLHPFTITPKTQERRPGKNHKM